ncbi:integrase catalytic domain-containing protein [Trichonephila clavipes]|nr:integrase catalytic domain-containing protein [Trichonephila clavipes]
MSIGKFKKDELRWIADELKLVVPDNAKVLDLRELIQESEIYKNDKKMYQAIVDCVLEEINDRRNENENRLEIEKIKLSQLEKELEIAKLHNQSGKSLPLQNGNQLIRTECNIESLIKSIKILTIPVPLREESFNLFFQSIEKAFKTKNVPEKLKPEILLNILGEKANNLMIYLRKEDLSDYNKLKIKCEFYNYYCQLREVNDFKSACELIISDKIIETLDRELNAHIGIKQGEMWFKPQELAREWDIFISSKGKIREQNSFPKFKRNEAYNHRGAKNISSVNLSSIKNVKCFCYKSKEFHPLNSCPKFKSLSVSESVGFVKANHLCFKCFSPNCNVKSCLAKDCFCKKPHNFLIHFSKPDKESVALNQTVQRSVLNPLADAFEGPEGSDYVVPSQGGNEENKSFVATSFLKNKKRTVLLSSIQCLIKDKFGAWHQIYIRRISLTTLNQIEGVLNSRPLYPLSCDPEDFDALTPGYFLVGRPITAIAEPSLTEVSDNSAFAARDTLNSRRAASPLVRLGEGEETGGP